MDFMTLGGLAGGALVLTWGMREGGALAAFINAHGILIVAGGTFCAAMVNCSAAQLFAVARAVLGLFGQSARRSPEEAIGLLMEFCRDYRRDGGRALREASGKDAFMDRCLDAASTLGDRDAAREALERDINQMRARHTETANVLRVMGVLAPMFGLLGTLIGIISVLRNLSDAAQVGPAMATAISSAFYGIVLSNLVFLPMANKLRARSLEEALACEVFMSGALDIFFTTRAPSALEAALAGFLSGRRAAETGGAEPRRAGLRGGYEDARPGGTPPRPGEA